MVTCDGAISISIVVATFALDAPDFGERGCVDLRRATRGARRRARGRRQRIAPQSRSVGVRSKVFYNAGLYEKASRRYMEAFQISKRPSLVYNAARAYQEGHFYQEAIALYRHYRTLDGVNDEGRADADARIVQMEAALKAAEPKVLPKLDPKVEPKVEPKIEPKLTPKLSPKWSRSLNPSATPKPATLWISMARSSLLRPSRRRFQP